MSKWGEGDKLLRIDHYPDRNTLSELWVFKLSSAGVPPKGFCPYDATKKLKLGVNPNNVSAFHGHHKLWCLVFICMRF